jgi:hypothetical protein
LRAHSKWFNDFPLNSQIFQHLWKVPILILATEKDSTLLCVGSFLPNTVGVMLFSKLWMTNPVFIFIMLYNQSFLCRDSILHFMTSGSNKAVTSDFRSFCQNFSYFLPPYISFFKKTKTEHKFAFGKRVHSWCNNLENIGKNKEKENNISQSHYLDKPANILTYLTSDSSFFIICFCIEHSFMIP